MAVTDSREVVIEATPEEILDVIADVRSAPTWSPQYQSAEILDTHDDGRPKRVKMKIKAAGLTDEQEVEYSWTDTSASWTLIKAGQLKAQDASYTLTPQGDKTKGPLRPESRSLPCRFRASCSNAPSKGAMETATDGLRKQVPQGQKGLMRIGRRWRRGRPNRPRAKRCSSTIARFGGARRRRGLRWGGIRRGRVCGFRAGR